MTPILDYDVGDFEQVMKINVVGAFSVLKHVARVMADNGGGAIVNTGRCSVVPISRLRLTHRVLAAQCGWPTRHANDGRLRVLQGLETRAVLVGGGRFAVTHRACRCC
jgi:hypothetical protein